jgi:nucleoside-diphosphate-sugar epimerase
LEAENQVIGSSPVEYTGKRPGDVLHSQADISMAREAFGYLPAVTIEAGLKDYVAWAGRDIPGSSPPL